MVQNIVTEVIVSSRLIKISQAAGSNSARIQWLSKCGTEDKGNHYSLM